MSAELAVLLARLLLVVVFTIAAAAKLLDRAAFRKTILEFGVPAPVAKSIATMIPAAELMLALFMTTAPLAWWGGVGAFALLSLFSGVIAANLLKGRRPACQCFGQLHVKPIGWLTMARNAAFAGCAGVLVWQGPSGLKTDVVTGLAAAINVSTRVLVVVAGLLALLAAETVLMLQLFRQHGQVLLRLAELEARLGISRPSAPRGLPVGSIAPPFSLMMLSRATLGLADLLRRSGAVVLIFLDPDCQPCVSLLPEISFWQNKYGDRLGIALISHGPEQAVSVMAQRHDLRDVLIQTGRDLTEAYRVPGTPAAVLVLADGTIGYETAVGREAIYGLVIHAYRVSAAGSISGATREAEPEPALLRLGSAGR